MNVNQIQGPDNVTALALAKLLTEMASVCGDLPIALAKDDGSLGAFAIVQMPVYTEDKKTKTIIFAIMNERQVKQLVEENIKPTPEDLKKKEGMT